MTRIFFILLFLAFVAYGQQKKQLAIINTVDDEEPPLKHSELNYFTDRLRNIALSTLPQGIYAIMTQQSIVAFLGSQEEAAKKCNESEGCLAKLGREINADYIGQGRIGRFGKNFTIKVEVYDVIRGNLISSFTGSSKDIYGLLSVLDKEAPDMFKKMLGEQTNGTFTDVRDGKVYKFVKIGSQVWMAENLNYNASGSKCYDNKQANCEKYGRLYSWNTAKNTCPAGWHLPTKAEWETLTGYIEKDKKCSICDAKHLKATSGWNYEDEGKSGNGLDSYRFSALPGGYGLSNGSFGNASNLGNYWTITEINSNYADYRGMIYTSGYVFPEGSVKTALFSVRCLQD